MIAWQDGYVSDIEYMPGFYRQQMPVHLDTVCMLRNIEPPVTPGASFRYCELGCGVGESALAVAAANYKSEVWGFDFNPAHIARGRELATRSGLKNIRLEEASFEQLATNDPFGLPAFDYITLHGVWSWISLENRAHIVRFIDRTLKPGGVAYVSYNALPGWTQSVPTQRLLAMLAKLENTHSDVQISKALDMVRRISDAGSAALPVEILEVLKKERDKGNVAYLAHEYLNEHWAPCYQTDVAEDFAAAKMEFVGSANILENFPDLSLKPEQRAIIEEVPHSLRETVGDYFMIRTFRRDVYIRGARTVPKHVRENRLRQQKLKLVIQPSGVHREIKIPLGEAMLNEGFYGPALRALSERPCTIGELLDLPEAEGSTASPREIIGMLIGSHQAMAVINPVTEEAVEAARLYNAAHLADCADNGRTVTALVAPAVGSAVTVTVLEMLAYEALAAGTPAEAEALAQASAQLLLERGATLRHKGEQVESDDETMRTLRENMEKIISISLPMWQSLGAI
ncbi:methyltransferase regulatory domain-containing protein [Mesorhizobium sp. A623]